MTAGIVIDSWKLAVFSQRLFANGYAYTVTPGVTEDTLLLKVEVHAVGLAHLKTIVQAANVEAVATANQKDKPEN